LNPQDEERFHFEVRRFAYLRSATLHLPLSREIAKLLDNDQLATTAAHITT
jgi:hypothetical protein